MELPRKKTCAMKYLCGPQDAEPGELPNPRWTDIELAIRQLNGDERTLVSFGSGTPAPHMAIGGGRDGKYIVYATDDNITFYTMVGTDRSEGKVVFVAGGQPGDYLRHARTGLARCSSICRGMQGG